MDLLNSKGDPKYHFSVLRDMYDKSCESSDTLEKPKRYFIRCTSYKQTIKLSKNNSLRD